MKPKDFNFDCFLRFKEEKDNNYARFLENNSWDIPIVQLASTDYWTDICRRKEESLESQLSFLTDTVSLATDLAFAYLEPWMGVGVYAAAYGCKYEWRKGVSPQVRPIFDRLEAIERIRHPGIHACEEMDAVLEMIKYFKLQTGGELDISYTDTQGPNDTASLMIESNEFFTATLECPERLTPLLSSITKLIMEFSDAQRELIGDCLALPGHIMVCSKESSGISISDDNMVFVSNRPYEDTFLPYNNQLSRHFGGIALHTCGNAGHNLDLMKSTDGLFMVDLALGHVADPTPCDACKVAEVFRGSGIIIKAKTGWNEIDKIRPLIRPDLRLIVHLFTEGSTDERNRQFHNAKQDVERIKGLWRGQ